MRTEQHAAVRWLWLSRPHRRNALDPSLVASLDEAVAAAVRDERTAAVVIAGDGPGFCAGADLRHLLRTLDDEADPRPFLRAVSGCFDRVERSPKPVIAAVHGHVVAGGLELALACDVVIARAGTLIGDGHVRKGLLPAGGASVRLPRKVGEPLARRLMLSGELLPAEAFVACGFVHSVVPRTRFLPEVAAVAGQLAAVGAGLTAHVKGLLDRGPQQPDEAARAAHELEVFAEHWRDKEADLAATLRRFVDGTARTPALERDG
ncbi:enoyl-CoA hydratase/isomerase family protein [Streptomyces sp. HNM0575]|uniref:enoyl-CoA hydratase-related protein n=1 Tax=Streptomyces sp. HNM0575 TaxID=2716338 RepID=UPI00145F41C6|nr:enoyl-CoA hydratase/isomerase family protein [Streptomyces sp. HNM0575]